MEKKFKYDEATPNIFRVKFNGRQIGVIEEEDSLWKIVSGASPLIRYGTKKEASEAIARSKGIID